MAPGPGLVQAWSLKLLAIDQDPWTKLLPVITHNLELSCDAQQLGRRRVTYFYFKFFHSLSFSFFSRRSVTMCLGRPGPQSSVQLVKPDSSSFVAPKVSIRLDRSFSDLTFFIFPFIVSAGPELPPRTCVCFDKFNHRKSIKRGKTSSYHIWDRLSSLELGACSFFLS